MEQDPAALDVAEKTIAEPGAFMRTLDQTGNVGKHEFAAVDLDHAQLWMQRRERVLRNLRPGRAHRREKGRLAGVGEPDDAGIRDQLESQPNGALLARLARFGVARRPA